MKKGFIVLMALVMCAAMLCGCVTKKEIDVSDDSVTPIPSTSAPAESAAPSAKPDTALPEELVGLWTGTGEPEGGGSPISLEVTVNADATGEYTFKQEGYTESYPFTLEKEDNSFNVNIPADNKLGISSCGGTYEYSDGTLTLKIKTEFTSGGSYAYTAVCTKKQAGAEAVEMAFPWHGHTMSVLYVLDDGTVVNGNEKPDGRYIKVFLECTDGVLSWDDIGAYSEFAVRDSSGKVYVAEATGFTPVEGQSTNINDMENIDYIQLHPIFDIPENLTIDELELRYETGFADSHGEISLKGIPNQAPEQQPASSAPAKEVDLAAAVEFVKSSESIDGMKPGVKTSAITKKLGKEDDFPAIIMENMQMFYFGQGYIFSYLNSSKKVTTVSAMPPAAGKTARGVGIGSTEEEVRAAYADGINTELSEDGKLVFGDTSASLEFIFEDGVVNLINLSY